MSKHAVARRYAEALVEVASNGNLLDEVQTQLRSIVDAVEEDPQLAKMLADPQVLPEKKKAVLTKLFSGNTNTILINTLKILVDKKRMDHLKDILDQYIQLANDVRGIAVARVTSATKLDSKECDLLKDRLAKMTGKEIQLEFDIDPDLIGGAKVRIGDTVIDASITNRLLGLERNLSKLRFDLDSGDTD